MNARIPLLILGVGALTACDRSGLQYVPDSIDGFPGIVHLGELTPVPEDDRENHLDYARYETLGPSPSGTQGGATATVKGTGGTLCVVVDPEAISWNQSVAVQGANKAYTWPDNAIDDGDIDMEIGLAGYYNGTPGVEIGDFEQVYEDSLGTETAIAYNECTMLDVNGREGAHAGRGAPEYCAIDTSLHPDRSYMVLLESFMVPLEDFKLSYAVNVYDLGDATTASGCLDMLDSYKPSNAGAGAAELLLPQESDAEGFADFEVAYAYGLHSMYCGCAADPTPENALCEKLEKAEGAGGGIAVDYGAATIDILKGNGNSAYTIPLVFQNQCGDYDEDAFDHVGSTVPTDEEEEGE